MTLAIRPYQFITTPQDWADCVVVLRRQPRIAIDLEANSLYAYHERICLIQITVPSADYIIDPLAKLDLELLGELVGNAGIEKVLHSSEYDLILMKKQFDWELKNLFDTMWGARILGYHKMGLANLLYKHFDVTLNKKFQKANWCKRPLASEKLRYAQLDTHFLLRLRSILAKKLHAEGHWEEAQEIFTEQAIIDVPDTTFAPEHFWRLNQVYSLNRRQQAVARAITIFRNAEGCRQDRPVFRIFSDKTVIEIARKMPANMTQLADINGMSPRQLKRYGKKILKAVSQGKNAPPPTFPHRPPRPPKTTLKRYNKLREWRKKQAIQRGVESDVILCRQTLHQLAQQCPTTPEQLAQISTLGAWRRKTYGEALLQLLRKPIKVTKDI